MFTKRYQISIITFVYIGLYSTVQHILNALFVVFGIFFCKKNLLFLTYTWTNFIFDSLMRVQVTKVSRYTIYWTIYVLRIGMIFRHQSQLKTSKQWQYWMFPSIFVLWSFFWESKYTPTNNDFVHNVTHSLTLYYAQFKSLFRKNKQNDNATNSKRISFHFIIGDNHISSIQVQLNEVNRFIQFCTY